MIGPGLAHVFLSPDWTPVDQLGLHRRAFS
jgi:hypothetical protein